MVPPPPRGSNSISSPRPIGVDPRDAGVTVDHDKLVDHVLVERRLHFDGDRFERDLSIEPEVSISIAARLMPSRSRPGRYKPAPMNRRFGLDHVSVVSAPPSKKARKVSRQSCGG